MTSEELAKVIGLAGAIITLATAIVNLVLVARCKKPESTPPLPPPAHPRIVRWRWIIFCVSALVAIIAFLYWLWLPRVEITSPTTIAGITHEADGAHFDVAGTSRRVHDSQRIVIMIHVRNPFIAGWFAQREPDVASEDGTWSVEATVGNPQYPAQPGQQYDLSAVVVRAGANTSGAHVGDPLDLHPLARSTTRHITVH